MVPAGVCGGSVPPTIINQSQASKRTGFCPRLPSPPTHTHTFYIVSLSHMHARTVAHVAASCCVYPVQDPNAHMMFLKPSPPAASLIDSCMECGYCEAVCPSRSEGGRESLDAGEANVAASDGPGPRALESLLPLSAIRRQYPCTWHLPAHFLEDGNMVRACMCSLLFLLCARDITITPRQRIQTYREITRLRALQDPSQEQRDR